MDDGTVDGMNDERTNGWKVSFHPDVCMESFISSRRLHGKLHFIPKLHAHDVAGGWTGQMMNEKNFISSRPRQTTTTPIIHALYFISDTIHSLLFHRIGLRDPLESNYFKTLFSE
jgi:hypothetical protein